LETTAAAERSDRYATYVNQRVAPCDTERRISHFGDSDRVRLARLRGETERALPQFMTEIDGLDIHFIHVRSGHPDALPLIITHGWPGSVIELLQVVGPLTDPTAHEGSAEDAFDLVLPSLPGYGFSAEPTSVGWDPGRTARAWAELMNRLGYREVQRAERVARQLACKRIDQMGEELKA
jgi:pimeloyl-ACP methyl ester carboxylesterase